MKSDFPLPQLPFFRLFIAWTLFVILVMGGVAAVAIHFISKFW